VKATVLSRLGGWLRQRLEKQSQSTAKSMASPDTRFNVLHMPLCPTNPACLDPSALESLAASSFGRAESLPSCVRCARENQHLGIVL
jgi:hypothetical protein